MRGFDHEEPAGVALLGATVRGEGREATKERQQQRRAPTACGGVACPGHLGDKAIPFSALRPSGPCGCGETGRGGG
jgi:hypothetical protein